jgi:hypothetical protein
MLRRILQQKSDRRRSSPGTIHRPNPTAAEKGIKGDKRIKVTMILVKYSKIIVFLECGLQSAQTSTNGKYIGFIT